jgi:NADH:ubiquinone oxidoreductase subunit F (NADH-binding)
VLDGLQLAAEAVGAQAAYLYVPADLVPRLGGLLDRRRGTGWDRTGVRTVAAPPAFVAGEESAVVAAIEGRPALPRDTPRLVVESGVRKAPTLVQNVETLAHVALIGRYGPAWFRSQGTATEPGTFLASVGGAVSGPGVFEAPLGVSLHSLLSVAGGPAVPLQAVLIGGYHGAWVPADGSIAVSQAGLAPFGATPGAGVVQALPAAACGLVESATIADYLARQSTGQCGPCRNGLPRLAEVLGRLARRDRCLPSEVERLARLAAGRGACKHPDGTARFVFSTMRAFKPEIDAHLAGHCRARA